MLTKHEKIVYVSIITMIMCFSSDMKRPIMTKRNLQKDYENCMTDLYYYSEDLVIVGHVKDYDPSEFSAVGSYYEMNDIFIHNELVLKCNSPYEERDNNNSLTTARMFYVPPSTTKQSLDLIDR